MTEAERLLWSKLRYNQLGFRFRRQKVIGNYIVDFICYSKRLIIELDGSQHIDSDYDKRRDKYLTSQGFKILRFFDNEVLKNIEGVLEIIKEYLSSASSDSSLEKGRE